MVEPAVESTVRLACVLLVDERGWVLLQERDEHAPAHPDQWGAPGGHVEDDEDFEEAAYRELAEETEVVLPPGTLALWEEDLLVDPESAVEFVFRTFAARTSITDADVVCHEGRQIVFVDPDALPTLPVSEVWAPILERFLASTTYAELTRG